MTENKEKPEKKEQKKKKEEKKSNEKTPSQKATNAALLARLKKTEDALTVITSFSKDLKINQTQIGEEITGIKNNCETLGKKITGIEKELKFMSSSIDDIDLGNLNEWDNAEVADLDAISTKEIDEKIKNVFFKHAFIAAAGAATFVIASKYSKILILNDLAMISIGLFAYCAFMGRKFVLKKHFGLTDEE